MWSLHLTTSQFCVIILIESAKLKKVVLIMNQSPYLSELQQARNRVLSEVVEQIRCFDLTYDSNVNRIHKLMMILDLLDKFIGD